MSKNEKIGIGVLVLITVLVIIVAVVLSNRNKEENNTTNDLQATNTQTEEFVNVLNDGTRVNTSDKLHETKTFDGMEISDFQLTENGNVTLLLGTITNTSSEKKGGYPISIKVLDKDGNELTVVAAYIGELEPGESTQLNSSATFDFANAYDFEITKR